VTAPLSDVLAAIQRLAPLEFAEPWDNVGLLLEPAPVARAAALAHALLTIDLSDAVVDEAQALGARLIIAYHPPIFQGLKRLRSSEPAERVILRCAAHGIAIFSPHTALDAAPGGVNDWLLDAFTLGERGPCASNPADPRYGQGRFGRLVEPLALVDAVTLIKSHLGLAQLRVSAATAHVGATKLIRRVAVCAGAGGAVLEKLSGFDLFLTGEMRHHDVRARAQSGCSVVLCEHTNTERGYLRILAARLARETNDALSFHVSQCDREPLSIV
jgi:dinuclear metal center YbgI/SA1388 family protein